MSKSQEISAGERFFARMYAARAVPFGIVTAVIPFVAASDVATARLVLMAAMAVQIVDAGIGIRRREQAMIVYRRSEEEMPARAEEIKHACEEGTQLLTLHNPVEYIGDSSGRVVSMRLQRMELGAPDESGRRRPVAIPGDIVEMPVDEVVVCIGYSAHPLVASSMPELKVDKWGNILVNDDKQTSMPDVYAGGDIVRGAATVILAMGDGQTRSPTAWSPDSQTDMSG